MRRKQAFLLLRYGKDWALLEKYEHAKCFWLWLRSIVRMTVAWLFMKEFSNIANVKTQR